MSRPLSVVVAGGGTAGHISPALALAAIGLLGSVAWGRSPMGLLLPAVVALVMQLAQMLRERLAQTPDPSRPFPDNRCSRSRT